MSQNSIAQILESRRKPEAAASGSTDKFFQVLNIDGKEENFLELQFSNGLRTCFSFNQLGWYNYDPEAGCLDLDFDGMLVTIKGRGFYPALFQGIKSRRVAWIREADSEMQDHHENSTYVEAITITLPNNGNREESGD